MLERFTISINGRTIEVNEGTSVASALLMANEASRRSVRQELRAPFCGMGVCMECRAQVNGMRHRRTCQILCAPGMEVVTE
ncbi:MAG: (2Fe-2S)-binding protein [Terracidiphilus sp.]